MSETISAKNSDVSRIRGLIIINSNSIKFLALPMISIHQQIILRMKKYANSYTSEGYYPKTISRRDSIAKL